MLTAESSRLAHAIQDLQLLFLSLVFIPINTTITWLCFLSRLVFTSEVVAHRRHVRGTRSPYFQPRKVLVTGVGMTKGLSLARLFYSAGHNVIGADFEPSLLPTCAGRVSRSLTTFYKISKPDGSREGSARYAQSLLEIIRKEKIDLWVSCSGVASAVEDGQAKELIELVTKCKAVQYDVATTQKLHEKHLFMDFIRSLGLTVPDTHTITSHDQAIKQLENARGTNKKFIMKFIGTDDSVRGDMTLLPLATPRDTIRHIAKLPISEDRPWILQQFISGPEYCTHSLIVRGEIKAFVACPSSELLMHYEALPTNGVLSQSMQRFTQIVAAAGGPDFTGHLSFDFLVDAKEVQAAERGQVADVTLYPIECNPRAHTAVCLFNDTPDMVSKGYISLIEQDQGSSKVVNSKERAINGTASRSPVYPVSPGKYYWIGNDLLELVILPILSLLSRHGMSFSEVFDSVQKFVEHLIWWRDGTFEVWDPLPAWWLYHVSWPWMFVDALINGKKWSRVNVSTMKVFGC